MQIVRASDTPADMRPDGREVKYLSEIEINMHVDKIALIEAIHPADFSEKQHSHQKSFEVFYFLDPANYKINGEDHYINAGDYVVLEPGDVHGATDIGNKTRILVLKLPFIADDKRDEE